jgi:hypothetical protein
MPVMCLSNAFYRLLHRNNRREDMLMREDRIPIWEKYTLSVEEAAVYFRIGEAKLRRLISENADADYILWNGNRPQIKRRLFEKYIDCCGAI